MVGISIRRIRNTANSLMGTDVIKIVDVFAHQSLQVTLTENDDVIQAFAPNTTDEALTNGVGFWRTHRCFENINMAGNKREVGAELIIIIPDQSSCPKDTMKYENGAPEGWARDVTCRRVSYTGKQVVRFRGAVSLRISLTGVSGGTVNCRLLRRRARRAESSLNRYPAGQVRGEGG